MTSNLRLKNNLDLQNFNKIINDKKIYFIISFLPDAINKINELKYDLLLNNLYCAKIKNSIYKVLQSDLILKKFGKLSGTNYIIFSHKKMVINLNKLITIFENYKYLSFFIFGRINNIFYNEHRLNRIFLINQKDLTINVSIKINHLFLSSLLGVQQKYFFYNFIYIIKFACIIGRV